MVTSAHIVIILRKIWVCQYFSPSFFNGFLLGQFFFVFNTDHFWTCSIAKGVSFEQNVICSRSSAKQTRGTPTFLQFPHFCFLFFVSRSDFVFFAFQFEDSRKHIFDFYFKTSEVISIRLKKFSIDKSYFLFHCSRKLSYKVERREIYIPIPEFSPLIEVAKCSIKCWLNYKI